VLGVSVLAHPVGLDPLIAEAKRRSPSSGAIREDTPAVMLAEAYAWGGAAAISVLTEPHRFGGSLDDLFEVSTKLDLPTLCKDFIIDPVQLYEARSAGAAAVLLIVRALTAPQLGTLASLARGMGLETLVEVHSAAELEIALGCGPTAIGVNARDLETLAMDPSLHETLLPRIPAGVVAVAESGLRTREDVERVAGFGADAVLVGTAVAKAERPGDAVRALTGVRKRSR